MFTLHTIFLLGYFKEFRRLLDNSNTDSAERILNLIWRPLGALTSISSSSQVELIVSEFCNKFLSPRITVQVKNSLIPYLQKHTSFPYAEIIKFLNESRTVEPTTSLFYCVLALETPACGKFCIN